MRTFRPALDRMPRGFSQAEPAAAITVCPSSFTTPRRDRGLPMRYTPSDVEAAMPSWAAASPARPRVCVTFGSVLAVPGPVTSKNSVGCHGMLRSGKAVLVTSTAEVLEAVSPIGVPAPVEDVGEQRRTDRLGPHAQRLHDSLRGMDGASAEELARDCGLPLGEVRALLPELELSGFAVRTERGWSVAAR